MGVPGSLPPVPVRAVATAKVQDSGSESEEIICEGRVGVTVVNVGRTPDAGIRDADLSALRRPDGLVSCLLLASWKLTSSAPRDKVYRAFFRVQRNLSSTPSR